MDNFLGKFSYTFSITIQYATVFPIKNKFWLVILTFYFDLVPPFYFLKWNHFFSTFIPVLSDSYHYFKYLLSGEVCTNLQIKRFPLVKFWNIIWLYGVSEFQCNNIKKHSSHIHSFWNCLSRNLPWLITTSCLISQFLSGLSLDLKTSLQTLGRRFCDQIFGRVFHQIWSLN